MKKTFLSIYILIGFSILFILSSCKKSDGEESSFTWNYKAVDYTAKYTLARSTQDLGPNIIGGLGNSALAPGSGPSFRIHPLSEGLYILGAGENYFQFVETDGSIFPVSGILTITSVSNKRLSATFIVEVGTPGNQNTLRGTIANIPITP